MKTIYTTIILMCCLFKFSNAQYCVACAYASTPGLGVVYQVNSGTPPANGGAWCNAQSPGAYSGGTVYSSPPCSAFELMFGWPLISNHIPAPVDFGKLTAGNRGQGIELRWNTISEQNNHGFYIERSRDGVNFTEIGFVNGVEGGTSNIENNYSYIDLQPYSGINYYRLRQVDIDGQYNYTYIVDASWNKNGVLHVYPNPSTTDEITVVLPDHITLTKFTIQVRDILGRTVYNQSFINEKEVQLSVRGIIRPANYVLIVSPTSGNPISKRVSFK